MQPVNILLARIARGCWERTEVGTWLASLYGSLAYDPCRGQQLLATVDQEPTPAARNQAVARARALGMDVLVMVDDDMDPSLTFLDHFLDVLSTLPAGTPLVMGSPYCGARPGRLVQVMRGPPDERLVRVSRHEAATLAGDQVVCCVGTGLIACTLSAFDKIDPPYFDYEYTSAAREDVAATEDFYFGKKYTRAGGQVVCAWDCWSGHAKVEAVSRPSRGEKE